MKSTIMSEVEITNTFGVLVMCVVCVSPFCCTTVGLLLLGNRLVCVESGGEEPPGERYGCRMHIKPS